MSVTIIKCFFQWRIFLTDNSLQLKLKKIEGKGGCLRLCNLNQKAKI